MELSGNHKTAADAIKRAQRFLAEAAISLEGSYRFSLVSAEEAATEAIFDAKDALDMARQGMDEIAADRKRREAAERQARNVVLNGEAERLIRAITD